MFKIPNVFPKLVYRAMGVKIGKNVRVLGWPVIFQFSKAKIEIGDNCALNSSFLSNLIGLYQRTIIIARRGASIKIGNSVGISGTTIYAHNSIEIGDNTLIGANCKILDTDFHPTNTIDRLNGDHSNIPNRPIKIGKNVFIGCNAIILKGAEIGDNCIVGAGSVLSGKFEANMVIAGNPAKTIKQVK